MSETEPEGTEIYLVSVSRYSFDIGPGVVGPGSQSDQIPNTIKDAEDRIGSFADDPSTTDIDETILADAYYVNGGYVYPTHGTFYRNSNTLASNPIQLPPCYIYGGISSSTIIDQQDPLQCHMLLEFWPEGYANRVTTDWTITSVAVIENNAPAGNGYLISRLGSLLPGPSDHYQLSIHNRKWPTYPFQEQYDCIMQDNTRATFNTVEEAQAATNPSLLSLVELKLPSTNEFTFTGTLRISYEHTNSNTFTETVGITQTVYNKLDKYISKVQTIAPPGTQLGPGSAGYPDLPDGT